MWGHIVKRRINHAPSTSHIWQIKPKVRNCLNRESVISDPNGCYNRQKCLNSSINLSIFLFSIGVKYLTIIACTTRRKYINYLNKLFKKPIKLLDWQGYFCLQRTLFKTSWALLNSNYSKRAQIVWKFLWLLLNSPLALAFCPYETNFTDTSETSLAGDKRQIINRNDFVDLRLTKA